MRDCPPPTDGRTYYYRLTIALVRVDDATGAECDARWTMTRQIRGNVPSLYERILSEVEVWDMLAKGSAP